MHFVCPSCQHPIELDGATLTEEVVCPSCGSNVRLTGGTTTDGGLPHGKQLGRFELLRLLGRGAFGTVYQARDPSLDRVVALKVPRAGNLPPRGPERDRFLREA